MGTTLQNAIAELLELIVEKAGTIRASEVAIHVMKEWHKCCHMEDCNSKMDSVMQEYYREFWD